jgi:hypothetical protein
MSETEKWIRHGQSKVIALLHGIGAKDALDYWQPFLNVLQNDEQMESFDLFVWKYPTHLEPSLWRNLLDSVKGSTLRESAPRIKLLGGTWNTTYQTQLSKYQEVLLICHSMGGLVVKSWIIDALEQGQGACLNALRHVAFYATPHEGAPITTTASWNKQLKEMQLDSPFIGEVARCWHDHVVAWKGKALDPSTHLYNRYIPHLVIAGVNDNIVPYKFTTIKGMDTTLVQRDHSQVIQPADASDTRYKAWWDGVKKALQGASVLTPSSQTIQHQVNEPLQPSTTFDSIPQKALKVFFSYASEDEQLVNELVKQLSVLKRQGRIIGWLSRNVGGGEETDEEILSHLNEASIILLLISPDFFASEHYWETEVKLAVQKHEAKEARVIPILLRPTADWKSAPFGKLQALPRNEQPVISWPIRDEAFAEIARGIREAVEKLSFPNR